MLVLRATRDQCRLSACHLKKKAFTIRGPPQSVQQRYSHGFAQRQDSSHESINEMSRVRIPCAKRSVELVRPQQGP